MAKKSKTINVMTISAEQTFDMSKERFNGFQCGTGAFKSKKHQSRASQKLSMKKEFAY